MLNLVVVDNTNKFNLDIENVEIVTAKNYLANPKYAELRNTRVYNLCRSYKYQSLGYYVSLLAEARGHKVSPSITKIYEIKSQTIVRLGSDDLDSLIQHNLEKIKSDNFVLSIYFGKNIAKQYTKLSKHIYNIFPAPLLRANFALNKKWHLRSIQLISLNDIPESHWEFMHQCAKEFFQKIRIRSFAKKAALYTI